MKPALLLLPTGWTPTRAKGATAVTTARTERPGRSGMLATMRLETSRTLGDLDDAHVTALAVAQRRQAFDLEDEDRFDVAGHDATYARFGFRRDGEELLCEQWVWVIGDRSFVLTATMARSDYAEFCDDTEEIAESFRPPTAA